MIGTGFRITGMSIRSVEYLFPFFIHMEAERCVLLGPGRRGSGAPPDGTGSAPAAATCNDETEPCKHLFTNSCKGGIMAEEGS